MAGLPRLTEGEDVYDKPECLTMNLMLLDLFLAKYPEWDKTPRTSKGTRKVALIPNGEGDTWKWMLRNCAGRADRDIGAAQKDDEE